MERREEDIREERRGEEKNEDGAKKETINGWSRQMERQSIELISNRREGTREYRFH